ncbi:MAG: hypothetical protein JXR07_12190 [Reichenbachiella sp.]
MFRYTAIFLLVLSISIDSLKGQGQQNTLPEKWENGIVELRNGKKLRGKLFYNFIAEVIAVDDGVRKQGFTAVHVAHFMTINDTSYIKTHYYSFPFDGRKSKIKPFSFYELVYENGVVALMSRHEYIYKEKNIGINDPMNMSFNQDQVATEKVKEILYLTSAEAGILEYGNTVKDKNAFVKPGYTNSNNVYRDPRGPSLEGITNREAGQKYSMSKKVLEKIMADKYDQVADYAREKKIKPNTIETLTTVLDYYAELMKNNE